MKYFPMFVSLEDKHILVVGGGVIATRRISVLLEFGCRIVVISPHVTDRIEEYKNHNKVEIVFREYEDGDCKDFDYVLATTDKREVNHRIVLECNQKNININVCDCKEECDFYFPAVIFEEDTVIGVTASGKNHRLVKQVADRIRSDRENIFETNSHTDEGH